RPEVSLRQRRNVAIRKAYVECAETAGPPIKPDRADQPVFFRPVLGPGGRLLLTIITLASAGSSLFFLGWLLLPEHVPGGVVQGGSGWQLMIARLSYILMIVVELIRFLQSVTVIAF